MKAKTLMVALFATIAWGTHAQSDDSTYINKAVEKLAEGDCQSAQRYYNVYKEMSGKTIKYLENEIKDCFAQKERQSATSQNLYLSENRNKYVAWGIIGGGYPGNLITSIEARFGKIVGFGLYGDIGIDFTSVSYIYRNTTDFYYGTFHDYSGNCTKTAFRYTGGIKFFLYEGLFLSCGYGTIAQPKADVSFNTHTDSDYSHSSGYVEHTLGIEKCEQLAKDLVKNSHGLLLLAGYNLVTDLSETTGFFLGISGGVSYDVINKAYAPSINLKIGVAWQSK